jgi:soluble lytic murein transglycosylase-like protein
LIVALGYGAIALAAGAQVQPGRSITLEPRPIERTERAALHPHAERLARRFGVGDDLAALIYEQARLADVEPAMAFGMVAQESGFDPAAVGRQGERGLMQIKPSTARAYDAQVTPGDLHDPELNLRLALRHLKREVEYFGDRSLGLMSYHMGRARLERELADGVPPRDRYVDRVLSSCGSDCG